MVPRFHLVIFKYYYNKTHVANVITMYPYKY